jgi:hypothetical protein
MIDVKEENDGSFTISWDENDPIESILNTWTEEDFIDCIRKRCKEVLGEEEYNNILNAEKSGEESPNVIYIDQTEEEVIQDLNNAQAFIRKDDEDERTPRLFF